MNSSSPVRCLDESYGFGSLLRDRSIEEGTSERFQVKSLVAVFLVAPCALEKE